MIMNAKEVEFQLFWWNNIQHQKILNHWQACSRQLQLLMNGFWKVKLTLVAIPHT